MTDLFNAMQEFDPPKGSAKFSGCGRYRYELRRYWRPLHAESKWLAWIMLNPSTANAADDDPTISNIVARTKLWTSERPIRRLESLYEPGAVVQEHRPFHLRGIDGIIVGNLYARKATDPMDLLRDEAPIGTYTDQHLKKIIAESEGVICAWGNGPWSVRQRPNHWKRVKDVVQMIHDAGKCPFMLDRTASNMPRHPLYWPLEADPVPYVL